MGFTLSFLPEGRPFSRRPIGTLALAIRKLSRMKRVNTAATHFTKTPKTAAPSR